MPILRNKISSNFTMIVNNAITDLRISPIEFRIYCYLCSRPDGWKINNSDIMRKMDIRSRDSIAKYWANLLRHNFIDRTEVTKGGKFSGFDYEILPYPNQPHPKESDTEENRILKNRTLSNTESSNTESSNNIDYNSIISYLNEKAKTSFRSSSRKTRELIRARFNEKFTEADFRQVIDNMVSKWLNSQMEMYLRPSTLFGSKFENYLNAKFYSEKKEVVNYGRQDEHEF